MTDKSVLVLQHFDQSDVSSVPDGEGRKCDDLARKLKSAVAGMAGQRGCSRPRKDTTKGVLMAGMMNGDRGKRRPGAKDTEHGGDGITIAEAQEKVEMPKQRGYWRPKKRDRENQGGEMNGSDQCEASEMVRIDDRPPPRPPKTTAKRVCVSGRQRVMSPSTNPS